MRQVEVMGNPKAELFDRGVSRYRAQRALGNEEGDIPSGKVRGGGGGCSTRTPAAGTMQPPEAMG